MHIFCTYFQTARCFVGKMIQEHIYTYRGSFLLLLRFSVLFILCFGDKHPLLPVYAACSIAGNRDPDPGQDERLSDPTGLEKQKAGGRLGLRGAGTSRLGAFS